MVPGQDSNPRPVNRKSDEGDGILQISDIFFKVALISDSEHVAGFG